MHVGCRGAERGTARPEVLQQLLKTTERIVQQVDSVEYGLTDIQEYYVRMTGEPLNTHELQTSMQPITTVEFSYVSLCNHQLNELCKLFYTRIKMPPHVTSLYL